MCQDLLGHENPTGERRLPKGGEFSRRHPHLKQDISLLYFAQRWSQRDLQRQLTTKGEADGTSCEGGIKLTRPANDLLFFSLLKDRRGGQSQEGDSPVGAPQLACCVLSKIPACPITFSTPWWYLPPHRISYEWNLMTSWSRTIGFAGRRSVFYGTAASWLALPPRGRASPKRTSSLPSIVLQPSHCQRPGLHSSLESSRSTRSLPLHSAAPAAHPLRQQSAMF